MGKHKHLRIRCDVHRMTPRCVPHSDRMDSDIVLFPFPVSGVPIHGIRPRSNADHLISKHQRRTRRRVGLPRAVDLHDLNVGIGEHGGCASHKIAEECGAERHVRREENRNALRQCVYHADIVRRLPRSRNHRGDRSAICKIAHLAGRARVGEVDHAVCAFPDIGKRACRFDPARKRFPRGKRIRCTRKPGIAEASFDRGDNLTAHAPERAVHYYPHIRFTLPICESLLSHDNLSCENGDTPLSQIFSFYYISADKRYVFPRPS